MSVNDFDDVDSIACKQRSEEPQPPTESARFQRDLLAVIGRLSGDRSNGETIHQQLEQYHDTETNHGQLYQNLCELVEEGCVEKRSLDGRTNMYRLTEIVHMRMTTNGEWVAGCFVDCEPAAMKGEGHQ